MGKKATGCPRCGKPTPGLVTDKGIHWDYCDECWKQVLEEERAEQPVADDKKLSHKSGQVELNIVFRHKRGQDGRIAPHGSNRRTPKSQDGRTLRRYCRRWKVERFFAWLHNFRRLVTRWEYYESNFLAMVQLGCLVILLRHL